MAKAVIFDKDGVVIDSGRLHYEKWKKTLANFDKKLKLDFYKKNIAGRSAPENIKRHFPDLSGEDIAKLLSEQIDFITTMFDTYVTLVPGVVSFLSELKKHNVKVAMATSSRIASTDIALDRFALRSFFQSIVTADDVQFAKPNPEIYLKAAERLGVKPGDCVVFEDSYLGVESAKKANMKVILVMTSHSRKDIPSVDMAIKDFTHINVSDVEMI